MTKIKKINKEYKKLSEKCFAYGTKEYNENEVKKNKLKEQYIKLLPENKQLAIYLFKKLNNDCYDYWYVELDGLIDNWEGIEHKKYLNKANELLQLTSIDNIIKIIDTSKTAFWI